MMNQNRANVAGGKQKQNADSAPLVAGPESDGDDSSRVEPIADGTAAPGEGSAVLVAGSNSGGKNGKNGKKRARKV